MNSTKKGSYNSASTEEYTIRPNPANNTDCMSDTGGNGGKGPTLNFAERAVAELRAVYSDAGQEYPNRRARVESLFIAKLAEAEQRGRDSAVDYIYDRTGIDELVKVSQPWYEIPTPELHKIIEAARHLTTPS